VVNISELRDWNSLSMTEEFMHFYWMWWWLTLWIWTRTWCIGMALSLSLPYGHLFLGFPSTWARESDPWKSTHSDLEWLRTHSVEV
jgi:hypothetical protein